MSEPKIPKKSQDEALTDILESIALEEAALAHLINAEAEKLQKFGQLICERKNIKTKEIIEFQQALARVMRIPIKKQLLLQFKLEDILDYKRSFKYKKEKKFKD